MGRRQLSPDEQTLWTALIRSIRPIRPVAKSLDILPIVGLAPSQKGLTQPSAPVAPLPRVRAPTAVLDSNWEKRIRAGSLTPEMVIDLHGHSLSGAHARLNQALSAALIGDVRVLLVVTGKPPKSGGAGGTPRRGAIRAEIGQWLGSGAYADRIASVRIAHPRHGGDGALYVILRRKK